MQHTVARLNVELKQATEKVALLLEAYVALEKCVATEVSKYLTTVISSCSGAHALAQPCSWSRNYRLSFASDEHMRHRGYLH